MSATRTLRVGGRTDLGTATDRQLLYPLDVLYDRVGVASPVARRAAGGRIPSPYRELLVHEKEMTSTLEQYFDAALSVRVLTAFTRGPSYFRRVLLALEHSGRPVAMGAVRLRLEAFPSAVRARIVSGRDPLGRILRDSGIEYVSRPVAFFQVTPNSEMMGVLWMSRPQRMYGRKTRVTIAGTRIGDIVEILPPV